MRIIIVLLIVLIGLASCEKNYVTRPVVPAPCDTVVVEPPDDDDD